MMMTVVCREKTWRNVFHTDLGIEPGQPGDKLDLISPSTSQCQTCFTYMSVSYTNTEVLPLAPRQISTP